MIVALIERDNISGLAMEIGHHMISRSSHDIISCVSIYINDIICPIPINHI